MQICKGKAHFMALTYCNTVYSWGFGPNGELGQGNEVLYLECPTKIESLAKYTITKVICGKEFTLFLTKNGIILTCGSCQSNCLGEEYQENRYDPKIVKFSLNNNIIDVDCSDDHVVVIASDGKAYAWGHNEFGKMGINCESNVIFLSPTKVAVDSIQFKQVFCGVNCTAFIDVLGSAWLCGNNRFNKLSINRRSLLSTKILPVARAPQKATINQCPIIYISLGLNHTVFVQNNFRVIAAGCNQNSQLGLGHINPVNNPQYVSTLRHYRLKVLDMFFFQN